VGSVREAWLRDVGGGWGLAKQAMTSEGSGFAGHANHDGSAGRGLVRV